MRLSATYSGLLKQPDKQKRSNRAHPLVVSLVARPEKWMWSGDSIQSAAAQAGVPVLPETLHSPGGPPNEDEVQGFCQRSWMLGILLLIEHALCFLSHPPATGTDLDL